MGRLHNSSAKAQRITKSAKIDLARSQVIRGDAIKLLSKIPDGSVSLFVTSPPYNIGKEYERGKKITMKQFEQFIAQTIELLARKVKPGGSICWQVGNHVKDGEIIPLDILSHRYFRKAKLKLRNRIIWTFGFGLHSKTRLSGRYETLMWYTKGSSFTFNLDPIRIPQKYPGKRHAADSKNKPNELSGNPLGKNPSDFWEFDARVAFEEEPIWRIPNVKANHPEKTFHPCQFPVELVERCVLAFTNEADLVVDPFVGTGTTVIAAEKNGRVGIGFDLNDRYVKEANRRLTALKSGTLKTRPMGKQIAVPDPKQRVAAFPKEWANGKK